VLPAVPWRFPNTRRTGPRTNLNTTCPSRRRTRWRRRTHANPVSGPKLDRVLRPRLQQLPAAIELHHRPMAAVEHQTLPWRSTSTPETRRDCTLWQSWPARNHLVRQRRTALQFRELIRVGRSVLRAAGGAVCAFPALSTTRTQRDDPNRYLMGSPLRRMTLLLSRNRSQGTGLAPIARSSASTASASSSPAVRRLPPETPAPPTGTPRPGRPASRHKPRPDAVANPAVVLEQRADVVQAVGARNPAHLGTGCGDLLKYARLCARQRSRLSATLRSPETSLLRFPRRRSFGFPVSLHCGLPRG